jgi:hypothetical protein
MILALSSSFSSPFERGGLTIDWQIIEPETSRVWITPNDFLFLDLRQVICFIMYEYHTYIHTLPPSLVPCLASSCGWIAYEWCTYWRNELIIDYFRRLLLSLSPSKALLIPIRKVSTDIQMYNATKLWSRLWPVRYTRLPLRHGAFLDGK